LGLPLADSLRDAVPQTVPAEKNGDGLTQPRSPLGIHGRSVELQAKASLSRGWICDLKR
jgi:hypothetical protein